MIIIYLIVYNIFVFRLLCIVGFLFYSLNSYTVSSFMQLVFFPQFLFSSFGWKQLWLYVNKQILQKMPLCLPSFKKWHKMDTNGVFGTGKIWVWILSLNNVQIIKQAFTWIYDITWARKACVFSNKLQEIDLISYR